MSNSDILAEIQRLVGATRNLDYDPSQEGWVCGDHGEPECEQGECPDLPWPEPNHGNDILYAFMEWADTEFRRAVRPYDMSEDPNREMPDEAFRSYSVWEWPVGAILETVPAQGPSGVRQDDA